MSEPTKDVPEMRMKRQWNGDYRGIPFEIQNFRLGDRDAWTFYIYVHIDRLPEAAKKGFWLRGKKDEKGRVFYDYYKSGLIRYLEWHSGCTYYSKESGIDGSPRCVKVGCDYQHYWDEEHTYNEKWLLMDVKACINSLWERIPDMKFRCYYNGGWYSADQGEMTQRGSFLSFDGKKADEEWRAAYEAKKAIAERSKAEGKI